ncbi:MAG TPA: ABC transporter ATP-binding protein [Alphaproteobacteria bacterium]|nr:ABC transporter ATP-binding protein [Alphaproteobacteria bacterium]
MATPRLEFRAVTKRFGNRNAANGQDPVITAVEDVSLALADGEVVSLIGPSGCGKSTLLNLGSGLDRPNAGTVLVDGEPVDGPNSHVAFMLQKDLLLPWRTIRDNVELGQEIQGIAKENRRAVALGLIDKYHLSEFANAYPHQLSGGMRQRAALARTMAMDPDVLLLDEPFSALDAQTKMVLQTDLARTLKDEGKTAFLITHDLVEAVALSDRVLVMSARPGRIIEEIVVEMPEREKPIARRSHAKMSDYIARLMSLLHIGDDLEAA